jgi:hypothetical protein
LATVTVNVKRPIRQYQQWQTADITEGDILGVLESLGKKARNVTISVSGGDATIRFNTVKRIFKNQETVGNTFMPDAAFWDSGVVASEVEEATPDVLVTDGTTQVWSNEFPISDIKVVSKPPTITITVS